MKEKKIILEQTDWEELTEEEKKTILNWPDVRVVAYFRNQDPSLEVKKFRKPTGVIVWKKKLRGSSPPQPPTPQPPTSLSKYLGDYDGEGVLPSFKLEEKNGKLFLPLAVGGGVEFTYVSGNQFSGNSLVDYIVNFNETNGVITGGYISVGGRNVNFTRKNPNQPSPPSSSDFEWKEVAYDTYNLLKKAGKWVKEEGGKLYAYLNSALQAKDADENTWDCINKYNENWGYYKLLRGAGGDFNYEYSTLKINGEKTIFVYFKDGRFVIRGFDSDKDIPGEAGKWSCLEGGGYRLDYDDGRKAVFGLTQKEPSQQSGAGGQNNGQSQQPKPITSACKSITSCPSFVDFVNKNLAYKLCMKCPEIQNFQNNPVLKIIYFKKLKENNFPQKTDEIFGPIMKSAVEEYQEMNGIQKTGAIGHKTFIALKKDNKGRGV